MMPIRSLLLALALCAAALAGPAALGQPAAAPAGLVKRVAGSVTLERAGRAQPVAVGTVLQVGDVLRTGDDGAVGVTLADDTLLAAGPGSECVLSAFAFDATTHDGQLLVSLWRGTLSMVTGLIGKRAPGQVRVQTRTMVLGVRGTEFIVDAGEGDR